MSSHKSIRLFENRWMEAWTHVHPALPFVVWVPILFYLFYLGLETPGLTVGSFLLCGVLSWVAWTLVEYLLHRFLFHYVPKSELGKKTIYLFHGVHHDDPQDPTRLVMPPTVSLLLGFGFFVLFQSLLGPWGILTSAFFFSGYLFYDFTHYAVHHFTPRTPIGRFLKQNHMLHHYVEHGARWGVSSPLWDILLGTSGRRLEKQPGAS